MDLNVFSNFLWKIWRTYDKKCQQYNLEPYWMKCWSFYRELTKGLELFLILVCFRGQSGERCSCDISVSIIIWRHEMIQNGTSTKNLKHIAYWKSHIFQNCAILKIFRASLWVLVSNSFLLRHSRVFRKLSNRSTTSNSGTSSIEARKKWFHWIFTT